MNNTNEKPKTLLTKVVLIGFFLCKMGGHKMTVKLSDDFKNARTEFLEAVKMVSLKKYKVSYILI